MHKRVIAKRRAEALQTLGERFKIDFDSLRKQRYDYEHSELFVLEAIVEALKKEDEFRAENEPSLESFVEQLSEIDGFGEMTMHKVKKAFGLE